MTGIIETAADIAGGVDVQAIVGTDIGGIVVVVVVVEGGVEVSIGSLPGFDIFAGRVVPWFRA